ncbi:ferritin-like domain-containing protein [Rheinheimera hassiensis]|uniref:ferritin-like domain-containing protein n=1 Tax=Rheinheimera hassiensis TaxID=1193627 RepID=UPI001F05BE14|nr:PA2169 family four-helix-bundle protein [Rheinheimera hassiensis]
MAQLNTPDMKHVSDIIQVLNSGIEFYSDAKEKVEDQHLVQFFDRMVNARRTVKEQLQPFAIKDDGKREEGSAFSVEARKVYTKVIGAMSSDKDHTYISQLEEVEDKTLEEFRAALKEKQPPQYEAALLQSMATMQECHDEMRALKKSTRH